MKIEDIKDTWDILNPDQAVDGCEIKCPHCNEWSSHNDWEQTSLPCDLCGDHDAIRCPECFESFDHVWSPDFECRNPLTK